MIINEQTKEKISQAKDAYEIVKSLLARRQETEMHKEYMYALYLDAQNRVLCIDLAAMGTVNNCSPSIREILRMALIKNAVSVIVSHNHPSGKTEPSDQDRIFTKKLVEACKVMEIKLLDHVIAADLGFYSFQEHGFF